jgi:hypothetical protein
MILSIRNCRKIGLIAFAGRFGQILYQDKMEHYSATDSDIIQEIDGRLNAFNAQI